MAARMKQASLNDFIKERAELAGLSLSDGDVRVIREKWETSNAHLDDLISGLRSLRGNSVPYEKLLQLFN